MAHRAVACGRLPPGMLPFVRGLTLTMGREQVDRGVGVKGAGSWEDGGMG